MTAAMLAEYYETREKRLTLERQAKPLQDREDTLADQIREALNETGRKTAKRGEYNVTLAATGGRVAWKEAYHDLKPKAVAAGVVVVDPVAGSAYRLIVVPITPPAAE